MKKQSSFINNEYGFLLPFVLFIATILFLMISASIKMYDQEIELTYQNINQLKIETLFQMGYEKFIHETSTEDFDQQINVQYIFPDGNVSLEFQHLGDDQGQLHFQIVTVDDAFATMVKPIKLPLK